MHVIETTTSAAAPEFRELRERKVDLILGRISSSVVPDDLNVEPLFDEAIVVAASAHSKWAGQSNVDLADLRGEPWFLAPRPNTARQLVEDAFRAKGLEPPRPRVTTYSMQLRFQLLAGGRFSPDSTYRLHGALQCREMVTCSITRRPWTSTASRRGDTQVSDTFSICPTVLY